MTQKRIATQSGRRESSIIIKASWIPGQVRNDGKGVFQSSQQLISRKFNVFTVSVLKKQFVIYGLTVNLHILTKGLVLPCPPY